MKRITSRKADLRAIRPVSLAGMIVIFLLAAATFAGPYLLAATDKKDSKENTAESSKVLKGLPAEGLTVDEAILQALNRMGFGPRPGDLERVKEIGLQKWIDQQLHPDSSADSALDARLVPRRSAPANHGGFLEQPLQCLCREGRRPVGHHRV